MDLLEVKEHVPVAYRCTLNATVFRVIGKSLKAQNLFPKIGDIITSTGMSAVLEDAEPVIGSPKPVAQFMGVRTAGHTWDTTARGLVNENVNFVAIKVFDESEMPLI